MAISRAQISTVLAELKPVLLGGNIQKISQPLSDALSLEIRQPGQTLTLFVSAHPSTARLHALTQRLPNPTTPLPFCQFLRKHILGARIEEVLQVPDDRVIWVKLRVKHVAQYLVLALTGRSANLFLVNRDMEVMRSLKPDHHQTERVQTYLNAVQKSNQKESGMNRLIDSFPQVFPISTMVEQSYLELEQQQSRQQQQEQQRAILRKAIKKQRRRTETLTQDLEKAHRYCEYDRYGELLKTYLNQIQKGQTQITVIDYFDERFPTVTLPLDPMNDARGNLNDYFRKYRKFTGAEREIRPRLKQAQAELATLNEELHAAEHGEIKPMTRSNVSLKTPSGSSLKPKTALPYRRFLSQDGQSILVGKSAKDNDALTVRLSRPNDLWLHARGTPGSHVIIQLEKKQSAPPETLKDAATLALFYSDLRKSGKGEVIYTLRKHVHKPKGAKPGSVTITHEKTVWVYMDQARLDRLKDSIHC